MNSEAPDRRQREVKLLRNVRKIHRFLGSILFIGFLIVAVTGLLLGWKKHSGGTILPTSYQGTSMDLRDWLPFDSLHTIAVRTLRDSVSAELSPELERIDARPDKGMVKFVFIDDFYGIQLDGATGDLLHIERRTSDFIENIHDGSLLDHLFDTDGEQIKLVYTSIMGLSLLTFSVTGFWLWHAPKRLRKHPRRT